MQTPSLFRKNSFLLSVMALSFACAGLTAAPATNLVKGADRAPVKAVFTLAAVSR